MVYYMIVAVIFLIICLEFGLVGGLLYLCYLPIKRRLLKSGKLTISRSRQINKVYIVLLIIISITQTYFAFYPPDSFYKDEFKYNSGIDLPSSAKIIDKNSDYPDFHGDYWASAIIKLDERDYYKLKSDISKLNDFQIDTTSQKIGITNEYAILTRDVKESDIDIVFLNTKKEWFKVAFLKDKRTIIFERSST
jgi:hypothetical protein